MSDYTYVGIDVAKKSLCCSLPDRKPFTVGNDPAGIKSLLRRASACDGLDKLCFVMESTGGYSDYTADALEDLAQAKTSIVPPARIVGFRRAEQINTKNDPSDAAVIRRFANQHKPGLRLTPTKAQRHLRALQIQMHNLHKLIALQKCVREKFTSAYEVDLAVLESVDRVIGSIETEIGQLQAEFDRTVSENERMATDAAHMLSIHGIGTGVCNVMLTYCYRQLWELSRPELLKHCGMEPKDHQSGQLKGHTRMSKAGDGRIRGILYMAAMVSVRKGGLMHDYYHGQVATGKKKMIALVNVMRRLLFLIQGVVKSNSPFDINVFEKRG